MAKKDTMTVHINSDAYYVGCDMMISSSTERRSYTVIAVDGTKVTLEPWPWHRHITRGIRRIGRAVVAWVEDRRGR